MESKKEDYNEIARQWLESFLRNKYSKTDYVEVISPKSNISKVENEEIKKYPNYSLLDFSSDVLGILTSKKTKRVRLVLLNRSTSAISVKEIGEMNIYSHIAKPEESFIVSLKGLPNEVNSLLLDEKICSSLLSYNDKNIIILKLDAGGRIDDKGTFPRSFKNSF